MSASETAGLALAGWAAMAAAMALAFWARRATGNSGWIDAVWTLSTGFTGAALALAGSGAWPRKGIVALCAFLWAVRLGLHIVKRTLKIDDDPRYRALETEWGDRAAARLFLFLQAQAFVGAVLALAVALAALAAASNLRDGVALLVFAVAFVGEALADRQLAAFKADAANKGRICDVGLWDLSRHPNYFFEWLAWVSAALAAMPTNASGLPGSLALAAPAAMYWTLRFASGVPPLEAHMAATRGAAFERYKARTPEFFPRLVQAKREATP